MLAALKAHRHLRGQLVFCTDYGRMPKKNEVKHPLWRAANKAGLRRISWHTLRHTFALHLAMPGVPQEAVQELLIPRDAVKLLDHGGPDWRRAEQCVDAYA